MFKLIFIVPSWGAALMLRLCKSRGVVRGVARAAPVIIIVHQTYDG